MREPTSNRTLLRLGVVLGIGLLITLGMMTFGFLQIVDTQNSVERYQTSTSMALCAFRSDLQTRTIAAESFLTTHPAGIAGISAAQIQAGIANQQSTLRSLGPLVCR